eukprot:7103918-Prymnesium_polylepis.1
MSRTARNGGRAAPLSPVAGKGRTDAEPAPPHRQGRAARPRKRAQSSLAGANNLQYNTPGAPSGAPGGHARA